MKPNVTGLPDTGDYNLGRGILYGAVIDDSTGLPDEDGWRDLGNAPAFSFTIEEETLDHKSSREGTGTIDKQVTISKKCTVTFTLDEINQENMALFFSGDTASYTNPTVAGVAEQLDAFPNVKLGRWYDLTTSAGVRCKDIGAILIEKNDTVDVALVEGTDYVLDAKFGRFFLKHTAVNCANGDELNVTITASGGASTPINQMRALTVTPAPMALKFISKNPANADAQAEITVHQITVKSDGEFSLIGDDWTVMGFTGVAEANNLGSPDSPYITIETHADS